MAKGSSNIYGSNPTDIAERVSSKALGLDRNVELDVNGVKDSRVRPDGTVESGETTQSGGETIGEK